jgi:hypothetical protein
MVASRWRHKLVGSTLGGGEVLACGCDGAGRPFDDEAGVAATMSLRAGSGPGGLGSGGAFTGLLGPSFVG